MKFAAFTAIAAAVVATVSASPAVKRQEDGDCEIGTLFNDSDLLEISNNISPGVRALYAPDEVTPGVPFHVKFCSSTYFKTSGEYMILAVGSKQGDYDGFVVAQNDNYSLDGYSFDVTLQDGGIIFQENSYFHVIEVINDYYTVRLDSALLADQRS
jgi:hypothetical protein